MPGNTWPLFCFFKRRHILPRRFIRCLTETLEELEFVTRFQLQASPAVLARGMFGMLRYDATAILKAISLPAMVLAGDRDPVCKPEASERMQRDIPGAQFAKLAPAKHEARHGPDPRDFAPR